MTYTYVFYLFLVLVGTLAFARAFSISLSIKQKKSIIFSLVITTILFSLWDTLAVARGHWSFNPETVLGIWFGNLPLEEILFFIIIPFFGIVLYELFRTRSVKA